MSRHLKIDKLRSSNLDKQSNQDSGPSIHKDGWKMEVIQMNKDLNCNSERPAEDIKDGENDEIEMSSGARNP